MIPTQVIQTLLWLIPLPPILAFGIIALGVNRSRMLTTLTSMALAGLSDTFIVIQQQDMKASSRCCDRTSSRRFSVSIAGRQIDCYFGT